MMATAKADPYAGWLRTEAAAAYLQVHPETVRNWARKGVIPAAKLGNRGGFRFRQTDLDLFIESRRVGDHR